MDRSGVRAVSGARAVVADEVPLVRVGIATVLAGVGVDVVGETHGGRDAARLAAFEHPSLVVLGALVDVELGDAVKRVKAVRPAPAVLALVARPATDVAPLLGLGADGLALRSVRPAELAAVATRVLAGEQVVGPALTRRLVGRVAALAGAPVPSAPVLSAREREVLAFLSAGRTNREIAAELFLSVATVKTHVAHVCAKLGVSNRAAAVGRAVELGLLG